MTFKSPLVYIFILGIHSKIIQLYLNGEMFVGKLILSSSGDYGYVATVWKFRVDHVLGFSTCCSVTFFVSRTWLPWFIFWKQIWKGPCNLHCHLNLCVRVFVLLSSPCFRRGAIWSGNEAANDLLWMWQGWWRQTLLVLLAGMCVCVCIFTEQ